ncbi:MAG: glycosyltransferase [Chthoniobacter sp.]|nr:glycosyltransferase [Chthoniobacter sp.]
MRVVHLCNLPIPEAHPNFGKIPCHPGRWVLNLALAQRAHGDIEPELVVQLPGATRDHETVIEGIPVHFVAAPDRMRSATLFYFDTRRIAARTLALRPDLVHAHGTEDCYALAAQHTRRPNVITAQGLFFIINAVVPPRLISRDTIVKFTERFALHRARHVIAKSAYVAEALHREFPRLTLHRIPNTFDPRLAEIRTEKEPRLLVFIGTPVHRKGLDLIANALTEVRRIFPDVRLWVFGDQPGATAEYEIRVKERLTALMGERVVFHGILPALEVARQLARATALVAPSREEMFGNQLIEALVVGTHGIVTEGTALAENVRLFGNGTVVPQEDAAALSAAMLRALQQGAFPEREETRRKIFAVMGPEVVARQHADLYRQVLHEA